MKLNASYAEYIHSLAELGEKFTINTWKGSWTLYSSREVMRSENAGELYQQLKDVVAGVAYQEKVIVITSQSFSSALAFFALWEKGAVVVPINDRDSSEKTLRNVAQACNARFIFDPQKLHLQVLEEYKVPFSQITFKTSPKVTGVDLALIIYTSGSSGNPKGIVLTHGNILSSLRSISSYLELTDSEKILVLSPFSFDYGLYQLLFSLTHDCHLVFFDRQIDPLRLIKALESHEISLLPVVPTLAAFLAKGISLVKANLLSLKKITNTGGHLPRGVIEELRKKLPQTSIYAMYGLSECKRALYLPPQDLERKIDSVGVPIPGLEAKVLIPEASDNEREQCFREADPGEIGELFVRGSGVMQGYYEKSQEQGARLIPGYYRDDLWLATGDLFSRDEEGYFYFRGRSKELIKQGGFCLYPQDIEEVVLRSPEVQFAALIGNYDRFGLEIAVLIVQLKIFSKSAEHQVRAWVEQHLEPNYRPRDIVFIEHMPVNHNGKVDKKKLREEFSLKTHDK